MVPANGLAKEAVEAGGFESVLEVLDGGAATVGPSDGDDVETGGTLKQVVALHIGERQARQSLLLSFIDGIGRVAGVVRRSRFHLDEDDRAAIDGYKIKLADVIAVAAGENDVAQAAEMAGGGVFAAATEGFGRENVAY